MTPRRPSPAAWRDTMIFLSGLALTFHEALVYRGPERWGLIILFGGMMGLPAFLRMDEKAAAGDRTPDQPSQPTGELPQP